MSRTNQKEECNICAQAYTASARKKIVCGFCNYCACKNCYAQYLPTKLVAQCMECNHVWDMDYIISAFSASFYKNLEKVYMINLFQQEKSLIPNTLQKLEQQRKDKARGELERRIQNIENQIESYNRSNVYLEKEILKYGAICKKETLSPGLRTEIETTLAHQTSNFRHIINYPEQERVRTFIRELKEQLGIEEPSDNSKLQALKKYNKSKKHLSENCETLNKLEKAVQELIHTIETEYNGERTFTPSVPCSVEKCKGFLNNVSNCMVCFTTHCKKCQEIFQENHECNKDTIETLKLLTKDSKPCPKCKVRITKIEGCNQMFCTECHTAFNWTTLEIEKGRIHNPHYFDWLNKGGREIQQHQNNEFNACGDAYQHMIRDFYSIEKYFPSNRKVLSLTDLPNIIRLITHMQRNLREAIEDPILRFEKLRISYIQSNSQSEEKWKTALTIAKRKFDYNVKVNNLSTMFIQVAEDLMNHAYSNFKKVIVESENINKDDILDTLLSVKSQIKTLIEYFNEQSKLISVYFKFKARPSITEDFKEVQEYNCLEGGVESLEERKIDTNEEWMNESEKEVAAILVWAKEANIQELCDKIFTSMIRVNKLIKNQKSKNKRIEVIKEQKETLNKIVTEKLLTDIKTEVKVNLDEFGECNLPSCFYMCANIDKFLDLYRPSDKYFKFIEKHTNDFNIYNLGTMNCFEFAIYYFFKYNTRKGFNSRLDIVNYIGKYLYSSTFAKSLKLSSIKHRLVNEQINRVKHEYGYNYYTNNLFIFWNLARGY